MRVKSIIPIGKRNVYDISVDESESYVLENGVITHNTGSYYSSSAIFIIGREQIKEKVSGKDTLVGYQYNINVEKSRYVKEKSKIPVEVSWEEGISPWSGLLVWAQESGHVTKPKNGSYQRLDLEEVFKEDQTYSEYFWKPVLEDPTFKKYIEDKFMLAENMLLQNREETGEITTVEEVPQNGKKSKSTTK